MKSDLQMIPLELVLRILDLPALETGDSDLAYTHYL